MEFIFEFLIELLFEGSLEISKNKQVPKIIRYPLIILISLFFLAVIFLVFFTGVLAYQKINKVCGILFIILGIILLIAGIFKFKTLYLKRKSKK